MKSKQCFILIGLPAVGKSSFSSIFSDDATIISSDAYIEERAAEENSTYDKVFKKYVKAASKNAMTTFLHAVDSNVKTIIVDRTNISVKSRRPWIVAAKCAGYKIGAIVFETPNEEEYNRRLASRPGKTIPKHIIESMIANFEEPTADEGFDVIKRIRQ